VGDLVSEYEEFLRPGEHTAHAVERLVGWRRLVRASESRRERQSKLRAREIAADEGERRQALERP